MRSSPICRRQSIRAVNAANSTASRTAARCSAARSPIETGIIVERDGFVFADLLPARDRPTGVTRCPTYPQRIVCLTEETTETLYLLGQGERVVGVSGYTVRPLEARKKPKVSAFINARFDKIEALKPDLVLAFSDLQADLVRELVRRGMAVVTFNQRTVAEILQMIRMLGGLVGCQTRSRAARRSARGGSRRHPAIGRAFSDETPSVLRGMGRPADLGDPLGRGARRDRRRRTDLSRARGRGPCPGSDRRATRRSPARSRGRLRLVVRQESAEGDHHGSRRRMEPRQRGA